mgnify:CR=1 FL=1
MSQGEKVAQIPTIQALPGLFFIRGALPGRPDVAEIPFSSLDNGIQPEQFPRFPEAASELQPGTSAAFSDEFQFDTGSLATGTSSIDLEGTLSKDLVGNVSFEGRVFGRNEAFNFDKPGFANAAGRRLPGRDFRIRFVGDAP